MSQIILSGAPGTGKTSVLNALKSLGYICMDESFREFVQEDNLEKTSQNYKESPLYFSRLLFESRKKQYHNYQNAKITFYDRSLIDILAYLSVDGLPIPEEWESFIKEHYYNKTILYFPFWEEIYQTDQERLENIDLAKEIDLELRKTYLNLGYEILEIPKLSIPNRVQFIQDWIAKSIGQIK